MTTDGADAIARYAFERKLGVRGLKSTLFKVLKDDMFDLKEDPIVIDRQYVTKIIA
jgi:ATP-dependent protease Clp ATPase subunit